MEVRLLRRRLMAWYDANARDLPWRRTHDPYAIWVSEIMLQQTRVETVIPYFERWTTRFPTIAALADAPEDEVVRAWAGLGYYSRARNLHRAATQARKGLPATRAQLQELPGVGEYTSAAIASIAFGEAVPVVDGNVERVVARLHALKGDLRTPSAKARVREAAEGLLHSKRAGDWNQAMMDLGATVCTPRAPDCAQCPVAAHCEARRRGLQEDIPAPRRRSAPTTEARHFAYIERAGHVLVVRNSQPGPLRGMWLLPGGDATMDLAKLVASQTGFNVALNGQSAKASHTFSHRVWKMKVRRGTVAGEGRSQHTMTTPTKRSQDTPMAPAKRSPGRTPGRNAPPRTTTASTAPTRVNWIPVQDLATWGLPAAMRPLVFAMSSPSLPDVRNKSIRRRASSKPE